MGKCIYPTGSGICGEPTTPLSQYCDRHPPDDNDELTLRTPSPSPWGDETSAKEGNRPDSDPFSKIK